MFAGFEERTKFIIFVSVFNGFGVFFSSKRYDHTDGTLYWAANLIEGNEPVEVV